MVPFINSWYFANLLAGVEAVCADEGYDVLVVTTPRPAARRSGVAGMLAFDRRVDGMIFVEVALERHDVVDLRRLGLGVVTIGQHAAPFSSVSLDNVAVGRLAVEHLVELGHSRIGIVAGQAEDPVNFDVPGDRIAGAARRWTTPGWRSIRRWSPPGSSPWRVATGRRRSCWRCGRCPRRCSRCPTRWPSVR